MKAFLRFLTLSAAVGTLLAPAGGARAQLLITGNDEEVSFDAAGKTVTHPPGKDTVSIIDTHDPTKPRILANLPLDELDQRATGQPRHHTRPALGLGRQFARLGQRR